MRESSIAELIKGFWKACIPICMAGGPRCRLRRGHDEMPDGLTIRETVENNKEIPVKTQDQTKIEDRKGIKKNKLDGPDGKLDSRMTARRVAL